MKNDKIENALNNLASVVSDLGTKVDFAIKEIEIQKDGIKFLIGEDIELKEKVSNLEAGFDNLLNKVGNLDNKVGNLATDVSDIKGELKVVTRNHEKRITNLETKFAN